jgi:hypothetical protein
MMTIDQAVARLAELRGELGGDAPLVVYDGLLATFDREESQGVFVTTEDGEEEDAAEAVQRWKARRRGLDVDGMSPLDLEEARLREASPALARQLRAEGLPAGPALEVVRFMATDVVAGVTFGVAGYLVPDTDGTFALHQDDAGGWVLSHVPTGCAAGPGFRSPEAAFHAAREAYRADPEAWRFKDAEGDKRVPRAITDWLRFLHRADKAGVPALLLKGCAEFLREQEG